jgi:hypothetical protein
LDFKNGAGFLSWPLFHFSCCTVALLKVITAINAQVLEEKSHRIAFSSIHSSQILFEKIFSVEKKHHYSKASG